MYPNLHSDFFREKDGRTFHPTDWIKGREVRVHKMPTVDERLVLPVMRGLEDLIAELGLDFRVIRRDDKAEIDAVRRATNHDGTLNNDLLYELIFSEAPRRKQIGKPHADVIVVDRTLVDEIAIGETAFNYGCVLISVPKMVSEYIIYLPLVGAVAKHEGSHLFGLMVHHGREPVTGYARVQYCNMIPAVLPANIQHRGRTIPTQYLPPETCQQHMDAMRAFWRGIERHTKQRYLR